MRKVKSTPVYGIRVKPEDSGLPNRLLSRVPKRILRLLCRRVQQAVVRDKMVSPGELCKRFAQLIEHFLKTGRVTYFCDCGEVAYKKDSSGWFCHECEVFVKYVEGLLEEIIQRRIDREQFDERPRREYHRHYERKRRRR